MNKIKIFLLILIFLSSSCKTNKQDKLYDKAVFHYKSREFLKAIQVLNQLKDSKFCAKEKLMGSSYYELKNYAKAIFHYTNYQKKCSSNFLVYLNKGSAFEKLNKIDSAFYYLNKAKTIDSTNTVLMFNLGVIHYKLKNDTTAINYLKKNLLNSSKEIDFDSYNIIEKILIKSNDYNRIFLLTDNLLKETQYNQDYLRLLLRKVYIYGDMGNWKKMRNEITKIIDNNKLSNSNLLNAHYNRYIANYKLNDEKNACNDYNILTKKLKSNNVENFFNCR